MLVLGIAIRVLELVHAVSGLSAAAQARSRSLFGDGRADGEAPGQSCPLVSAARVESDMPIYEDDPVPAPRKRAWEDALGGREAARPYVRERLRGWPALVRVDPATLPRLDRELVARIARDTWRGLDALTDREHALPIDHLSLDGTAPDTRDARVGDYTNITNVGLYLVAVAGAYELQLITEAMAIERIAQVLDTLDRLERHAGFFYNYYDTTSLERTSNFLSFVDSAWLTTGLIVARTTFPSLDERCSQLIADMDYGFFYDRAKRQMSHGYFVHRRSRSRYHYGVLYTESRLGALLAIGKGDVPEDVWFDMVRTYPPSCSGQTDIPRDIRTKTVRGHVVSAGRYEWRDVAYVPSWGGSMFEALMPVLVLDELRHAPRSLGVNDVLHAIVQRRYALEDLGYPVWGMSPSAKPDADGYGEYGAPVLGSRGYRAGAVTPHAAALALLVTPEQALSNLRRLVEAYEIYGDYGFYDAVDPLSGHVARTYLTLDQSMLFIAAVNYLKEHSIQERFASDPIVQRALPVIGAENFFD